MQYTRKPITTKAILICTAVALFYAYGYLVRLEPSILIPMLLKFYQAEAIKFNTMGSVFYYAFIPAQLIVGLLLDRFHPKKLLLIAAITVMAGLILFELSQNLLLANSARLLITAGIAFMLIGAFKIGTVWLPYRLFPLYVGTVLAAGLIGALVADTILTLMVTHHGWTRTIYQTATIGFVMVILVMFLVRDEDANHHLRYQSAITLQEFFQLLQNKQQWLNAVIMTLIFIPMSVFTGLWGIPFLEEYFKYAHEPASDVITIVFFGMIFGAPIIGQLSESLGSRKLMLAASCITAAVFISLLIYNLNLSHNFISFVVFIYGFFSGAIALNFVIAKEQVHDNNAATAMGLSYMIAMAGAIIILPVIKLFLPKGWEGEVVHGIIIYPASDYQLALAIMPLMLLAAGILAIFLKETYQSRD